MEPKVFDCGCVCALETDERDPTRTCDVFDLDRCAAHSVSASDPGPIADFIQNYKPQVEARKMEVVSIPPAVAKRVPAKLQKRREYYAAHKADYNKYELARLKKMLVKSMGDSVKEAAILKRIKKRESNEQIGTDGSNPQ